MANIKIEKLLSTVSEEDKKLAQHKLNNLCNLYGINNFAINSTKGKWRDVIYAMLDLPYEKKKTGGRPARTDDEMYDIANEIICRQMFFDLTVKEAINDYVKFNNIKFEKYDSGRFKDPHEVARGVLDRFPDVYKRIIEEMNKEDWS